MLEITEALTEEEAARVAELVAREDMGRLVEDLMQRVPATRPEPVTQASLHEFGMECDVAVPALEVLKGFRCDGLSRDMAWDALWVALVEGVPEVPGSGLRHGDAAGARQAMCYLSETR
ncbi:hypothetical protein [Jannaschia sp. LMIT008]|uniref:hypothetical protein n=1 Tax=Jannaschia maritima TaxID=3032585 RepID=UPI0028125186|nr:hypothetical protein [Jannaschia sp. LMIT008]